jgi:hypothetical protein
MSHKKVGLGVAVLMVSAVLGATVLREPIATAASPFQNVIIGNTASQPVPVAQQGTVNATVNGTVAVSPAVPPNSFSLRGNGNRALDADCGAAGRHWFISSFAAANDSDTTPAKVVFRLSGAGFTTEGPTLVVGPNQTAQLTFPQPFDYSIPRSACAHVTVETTAASSIATWEVVGYYQD